MGSRIQIVSESAWITIDRISLYCEVVRRIERKVKERKGKEAKGKDRPGKERKEDGIKNTNCVGIFLDYYKPNLSVL